MQIRDLFGSTLFRLQIDRSWCATSHGYHHLCILVYTWHPHSGDLSAFAVHEIVFDVVKNHGPLHIETPNRKGSCGTPVGNDLHFGWALWVQEIHKWAPPTGPTKQEIIFDRDTTNWGHVIFLYTHILLGY